MMFYHKDYLHQCALHILENIARIKKAIVIVPEKTHLVQLRKIIVENSTGTIEIPQIYSVEGLEAPDFPIQESILSRNATFAVLMEITRQANILPQDDIAPFVRAMVGDLPNLYAYNITPKDLAKRMPSTISSHRETNLNLCIKVWEAFDVYLEASRQIPYYAKNHIVLNAIAKHCIDTHTNLIIVDDFGRSPALKNLIKQTHDSPSTTIFCYQSSTLTKKIQPYCIQSEYFLEEKNIALVTKYLLSRNSEAKIAIVCEDEQAQRNIIFELDSAQIACRANISNPAENNILVRAFLLILQQNFKELIPLLALQNIQKYEILLSLTGGQPCNIPMWKEILETARAGEISKIMSLINTHRFTASLNDATEFWHFKTFLQNEISVLQTVGLEPTKNFILHVSSSWKTYKNRQDSNISICKLRDLHLEHYDAIILTSSYKTEPTGNVIFSIGMRKFYGFDLTEEIVTFLKEISVPILTTSEISEIATLPFFLKEEQQNAEPYRPQKLKMRIEKDEIPHTIPATWLETLFSNPLLFYYKHIKNLQIISYTTANSLQIGNTVHWILEKATKKIIGNEDFDRQVFILSMLKSGGIGQMAIFFLDDILQTLSQIPKYAQVLTEVDYSYKIGVSNHTFTLTARADRVDIMPQSISVFDYKTGSSNNFEKEFKSLNKVQLVIPMLGVEVSEKVGVYKFIGEGTSVKRVITKEISEQFINKVTEVLQEHFFDGQVFEEGGSMYAHHHVARI